MLKKCATVRTVHKHDVKAAWVVLHQALRNRSRGELTKEGVRQKASGGLHV